MENKKDNKMVMRQKDVRCTKCNEILYVTPFDIICANCKAKKTDKLEVMFDLQWKLQAKLGYNKEDLIGKQPFITTMVTATIDELMEALRETPWKPWKKHQELLLHRFKGELADALHFFINLCFAGGMDADELFQRYVEKNKINIKRTEDGY